ncbi:TetR/AcrR family transcriptional regulator [Martelella lutilitoris]|uniref:TetR/AcrR family transcriptional regulator n=1 Tax=Martelella lutilitoris TaxID=2583532 RepID=A0A7T7KL80_9HYPH|nr:TetR/AcrR family transcriptional regulator [Martelella lutilitoris]QQM29614.1 TetR/AcrR family transcriptional regulator [Martelella lutilitoris]
MNDDTSLRADAQRNRERIVIAAEEVFLERGAHVNLDEVAKRAGVGVATLYRRFPTREELLAATYSARFVTFAEVSRSRDADLDPLSALRLYLEELVQYSNVYRGLAASLGTVLQVGTPGCIATSEEGTRLLQRAQKAGVIRSDINFNDVVCVAIAVSLATEKHDTPTARITHLVGVFIDGMAL